ncbi:hypothetical protein CFBP4996_26290 (plasmid) [Agrobacterium leguminum]|uniref:hypothetical protein n=1 Tax=Agrobacterium leguminum TaxID=2792015 RepID=UPI0010C9EDA9|nr:hypothetical protein [Agrobacterium leguminum]WFS69585.1 hypothetical protein CFBP4996_26290 [Agrobacterium leguminum]
MLKVVTMPTRTPASAGTFFGRLALFLVALVFTILTGNWLCSWPDISLWLYITIGFLFALSPLAVSSFAWEAVTTFVPRPRSMMSQWDERERDRLERSATAVCLSTLPLTMLLLSIDRLSRRESLFAELLTWLFWLTLLSLAISALAGLIGYSAVVLSKRQHVRRKQM